MQTLLDRALAEIPLVKVGTTFVVKDLFKGYEWNEISINDRRNLGRFFNQESLNPYLKDGTIVDMGKNSANQEIYKKSK